MKIALSNTCKKSLSRFQLRYATLTKFDVQVASNEIVKLQELRPAWKEFLSMLDKAQHALDKAKVNMRRDLESNLEAYCQQVLQLREQVLIEIPTSQELTPDEAFAPGFGAA